MRRLLDVRRPGGAPDGEAFGLSAFLRDGDVVYRTYYTNGRGVEALGSVWTLLDLTPLGCQETWEGVAEGLSIPALCVVALARPVRRQDGGGRMSERSTSSSASTGGR